MAINQLLQELKIFPQKRNKKISLRFFARISEIGCGDSDFNLFCLNVTKNILTKTAVKIV